MNNLLGKKMPTLLGLIIIILGLSTTTFLTTKQTNFNTKAEGSDNPQEVRITNHTNNSFTVSYTTSNSVSGYINYGPDESLGQTSYDDRDISQKLQNYFLHSITVKNLNPETKYYFKIISGGNTYLNNGRNFEVSTAPKLEASITNNSISGKVMLSDSTSPKEAIAYLTSKNTQTLSTLVAGDGSYNIDLNNLLNSEKTDYFNLTIGSDLNLLITDGSNQSDVILSYSNDNSVPIVTISNNYDFRSDSLEKSTQSASLAEETNTPSEKQIPIKTILSDDSTLADFSDLTEPQPEPAPEILTPEKGQIFYDSKPQINGTALPNQKIKILIHSSTQIQATVTADSDGNWSYTPTKPLEEGKHTITLTATDASGVLKTITQSFVVYAAEDVSPPPASPTITPTPTTPVFNTGSIDSGENPTTLTPTESKAQKPLSTNVNMSIIMAGLVGLLITIVGGIIFLLSHKGN